MVVRRGAALGLAAVIAVVTACSPSSSADDGVAASSTSAGDGVATPSS
jgi:hypothetical protein